MNFKTKFTYLALASTLLASAAPAMNAKAVSDTELADAKAHSQSATSEIERYESKVASIAEQQKEASENKAQLERDAKALDKDSKKLTETIKSRNENLKAQARSAQVNSNSTSVVNTLLDSESLVDAIQKVSAIVTVTSANARMLKAQQDDMKALENKAKKLQENYGEYVKLESELARSAKDSVTAKAELEVAQLSYQATIAKGEQERANILAAKAQAESKVRAAKADAKEVVASQNAAEKARAASASKVESVVESQPQPEAQAPVYQAPAATAPQAPVETPQAPSYQAPVETPQAPVETPQQNAPVSNGTVWDYRGSFMTSSSNYNGYAGGGCTDYVWQWFAQRGVIIPNVMPGNGKDWAYQMPRAPRVVPGVIASFAPGAHGASTVYGHVAIVESVNADGSFVVSEGGVGMWGSTRTIPNQSGVTFVLP